MATYKETIRRVWDASGSWYTQVSPNPDGLQGMTKISHHEADGTGRFKEDAYMLLHEDELRDLVDILSIRLNEIEKEKKP